MVVYIAVHVLEPFIVQQDNNCFIIALVFLLSNMYNILYF